MTTTTPPLPPPALRAAVTAFYEALRSNDIPALTQHQKAGFPLAWAKAFAPESLPEYAMRHGSVEAAWWLMGNGVMPENWGHFTGRAWTSFVKKGLAMALSGDASVRLPLEAYKEIMRVAVRTTGERLPGWFDELKSQSQTATQSLWSLAASSWDALLKATQANMPEEPKPPIRPAQKPSARPRRTPNKASASAPKRSSTSKKKP